MTDEQLDAAVRRVLAGSQPERDPDRFRNRLAFFLIGAFVSVLPLLIFKRIPASNKEIIVYMIGQLSGMATMALGFYYTMKVGQDALDAKRADNTGKLADAVVAAANTTPLTDQPQPVLVKNPPDAPVPTSEAEK